VFQALDSHFQTMPYNVPAAQARFCLRFRSSFGTGNVTTRMCDMSSILPLHRLPNWEDLSFMWDIWIYAIAISNARAAP
jgi:hypothetical protein